VAPDRACLAVLAAGDASSPRDPAWGLAAALGAACRAPAGWGEAREVVSLVGRPVRSAWRKNRPDGNEPALAVEGGGLPDAASGGRGHRRGAARGGRRRLLGRVEPGEEGVVGQAGGACCAQGGYAADPVACRPAGGALRRWRQTGRRTDSPGQPGTARHPGKPGLGSHHRSSRSHPPVAACPPAAGDPAVDLPAGGHRGGGHGDGCHHAQRRAGSHLDGSRRRRGRPRRCRSRQDLGTRSPRPGLAHPGWGRCLDVSPGTSWTLHYTPCMGTCTFSP
jgi:hypothetical protein